MCHHFFCVASLASSYYIAVFFPRDNTVLCNIQQEFKVVLLQPNG